MTRGQVLATPAQTAVPEEIPTLDIGPYLQGTPGTLEDLAEQLRRIQQEIGFYFIVNHGVPRKLIAEAYEQLRRFYALPLEEKLKLRINAKSSGYVPAKSTVYVTSNVNQNTKPDLNECLLLMRERPADHPSIVAGRRFVGPNQWPDETLLPGFRATMLEYYAAMEALGYKLLPLYARALGLPKEYFAPFFTDPTWDTLSEALPTCVSQANPPQFEPMRFLDYLCWYVDKNYSRSGGGQQEIAGAK